MRVSCSKEKEESLNASEFEFQRIICHWIFKTKYQLRYSLRANAGHWAFCGSSMVLVFKANGKLTISTTHILTLVRRHSAHLLSPLMLYMQLLERWQLAFAYAVIPTKTSFRATWWKPKMLFIVLDNQKAQTVRWNWQCELGEFLTISRSQNPGDYIGGNCFSPNLKQ